VQQNSPAIINGTISNQTSYTGVYQNNPRLITSDFLIYEHTNGLNYLHITLNNERKLFGNKKQAIRLQSVVGLNAGLLVPKSDVKLMSYSENDQWHLAGYGFGINAGIKVNFWKHIFFRFDSKYGFINLPDVLTRGTKFSDRAKQHFFFAEIFGSFGYQISL
jgi:hypothetical protein